MQATPLARGAAEALAVMAAFVVGGIGFAQLERRALRESGAYPCPAMATGSGRGGEGRDRAREANDRAREGAEAAAAALAASVWLVDGFNVLCAGLLRGRERSAFWSEANRRVLLERAARFDDPHARVVVVFDGDAPAPAPTAERVEGVFARCADAWILARLREARGERVAVVTADRSLADRARHRGAEVVSPHAFLARCAEPGGRS
jgi:predicted RNA-binding protein with PIN domain